MSGGYSRLRTSMRTRHTVDPRCASTQPSLQGSSGSRFRRMARRNRNPKVLAIVLAGGEGKRLMPLTEDRAKPAVPFGGVYRLIDFALSNLLNSRIQQIVVLTQYKSHSLDRHIAETWRLSSMLNSYVASVPAQQRLGKRWYTGSAEP